MTRSRPLLVLVVLPLLFCSLSVCPALGADDTYVIGTADVLEVQVWDNKDLNQVVPVRPDGKISLPLIGEGEADPVEPRASSRSGLGRVGGKHRRLRLSPGVHLRLGPQEVLQRDRPEDLIDGLLDHSPDRADRTVGHVCAGLREAGVAVAEGGLVEPAAERRQGR